MGVKVEHTDTNISVAANTYNRYWQLLNYLTFIPGTAERILYQQHSNVRVAPAHRRRERFEVALFSQQPALTSHVVPGIYPYFGFRRLAI